MDKYHYIHNEMCNEILYLFPNFNGSAIEIQDLVSYFIPTFNGCNHEYILVISSQTLTDVTTNTYWDLSYSMLVKGVSHDIDISIINDDIGGLFYRYRTGGI